MSFMNIKLEVVPERMNVQGSVYLHYVSIVVSSEGFSPG